MKGNEAIVQFLLNHGADVNAHGGHYGNALQVAASRGNEAIVQLLLTSGADVNERSSQLPLYCDLYHRYCISKRPKSWPGL